MLTLFFFSLLLNVYYSSIIEHNEIGIIEVTDTSNESRSDASVQQDLLRRRLMPGGFTTQDKLTILNTHNKYRDLTAQGKTYGQPSSSDMNQLIWDDGLAKVAQDYSAKCTWAHNSNRNNDMANYKNMASFDYTNQQVGENLFLTTGSENLNSLIQGVQYWYNEYAYYTYGTTSGSASCTSGKQCGHYTQLVWATTRYVGCGYTKCASTSGTTLNNALLLVCNYYFSGNIVGYYPYATGSAGTQCPSDRTYQNGMCSGCPSRSWDTYCCPYCSTTTCANAKSSNLLTSPSSCTDGLGNSLTSGTTATTTTTTTTTTTRSPTTSTTTRSPTTTATTTTRSPTATTTTRSPTTTTSAPTTTTKASTSGCCKAKNSRYTTFCNSIPTSSVCGTYSVLCSWTSSC